MAKLGNTKTGASTRILCAAALDILAEIDQRGFDLVFPGSRCEELPYAGLNRVFDNVKTRAKLGDISPHTMRHSYASVAADADIVESKRAALLGHSTRSTTARYSHPDHAKLVEAANKIAGIILSYRLPVSEVDRSDGDSPSMTQASRSAGL